MIKKISVVYLLILVLGFLFLWFIGIDALDGNNRIQFFADSTTYLNALDELKNGGDIPLISVGSNYIGPVFIGFLFFGNPYLIFLFNCLIFFWFINFVSRVFEIRATKLCLLLMISPLTLSILLSLGKEIFIFPFLIFAIRYYFSRNVIYMLFAVFFAFMCRWHMVIFYFYFLFLTNFRWSFRFSRGFLFLMSLFSISFAYFLLLDFFAPVISNVSFSVSNYDKESSGIYTFMNGLQEKGMYFLVFPFKFLQLSFGTGFSALVRGNIFTLNEFYNYTIVAIHTIVSFFIFIFVIIKRKMRFDNDLFFSSLLFLLIFVVSPVFAPRYIYMAYVLWVMSLLYNGNRVIADRGSCCR